MCCTRGVWLTGALALFALVCVPSPRARAAETVDGMQAYSDLLPGHIDVDSQGALPPIGLVEQLSTEEVEPTKNALNIAEPGTLGLMALAGLMAGAVAMRRRLG